MILLTHIDLDGAGCAIVARHFFQENLTQIYHVDYDTIDAILLSLLKDTDEKIVISDISMDRDTAKLVEEKYSNRVELFDHHQTVVSYLSQYKWVTLDMNYCATKVMFHCLQKRMPAIPIPPNLEKLIFYVNDYDLWIHSDPETMLYNDLITLLGIESFVNMMFLRLYTNDPLLRSEDRVYLDGLQFKKRKYFQQCAKNAFVQGNRLVVAASRHISELSQYLKDHPQPTWVGVEYIDVINLENLSHSLRSYQEDFDVSKVAQEHGGGGHKKAAGYQIRQNVQNLLLQIE